MICGICKKETGPAWKTTVKSVHGKTVSRNWFTCQHCGSSTRTRKTKIPITGDTEKIAFNARKEVNSASHKVKKRGPEGETYAGICAFCGEPTSELLRESALTLNCGKKLGKVVFFICKKCKRKNRQMAFSSEEERSRYMDIINRQPEPIRQALSKRENHGN